MGGREWLRAERAPQEVVEEVLVPLPGAVRGKGSTRGAGAWPRTDAQVSAEERRRAQPVARGLSRARGAEGAGGGLYPASARWATSTAVPVDDASAGYRGGGGR